MDNFQSNSLRINGICRDEYSKWKPIVTEKLHSDQSHSRERVRLPLLGDSTYKTDFVPETFRKAQLNKSSNVKSKQDWLRSTSLTASENESNEMKSIAK